jgi:hypothetical protein
MTEQGFFKALDYIKKAYTNQKDHGHLLTILHEILIREVYFNFSLLSEVSRLSLRKKNP